jgi:hypothetical protein
VPDNAYARWLVGEQLVFLLLSIFEFGIIKEWRIQRVDKVLFVFLIGR